MRPARLGYAGGVSHKSTGMDIFLARQPIFDDQQQVFGYELLYRSGVRNYYDGVNGDHATSTVLDNSFFSIGLDTITGGKRAFVNFTDNLLLNEIPTIFPSDQIAIEILETVEPSREIVERCRHLKEQGYLLALDDFVYRPEMAPLMEIADIIKIDVQNSEVTLDELKAELPGTDSVAFLAERIETYDEFRKARESGYRYFQGFFFARPDIISGRKLPAHKLNYLRILQELSSSDLDFDALERIFKQDVSLSYKLLRYINSAYFGLPRKIRSIRHALSLIGLNEARKWLSLIALSSLGKEKSEELVRFVLARANMCELVAPLFDLAEQADELFLLGLFSLLDAFLDKSMPEALADLCLSAEIEAALLGEESPYQVILKAIQAYERGRWDDVFQTLSNYQRVPQELPQLFFQTLEKCHQIYPAIH